MEFESLLNEARSRLILNSLKSNSLNHPGFKKLAFGAAGITIGLTIMWSSSQEPHIKLLENTEVTSTGRSERPEMAYAEPEEATPTASRPLGASELFEVVNRFRSPLGLPVRSHQLSQWMACAVDLRRSISRGIPGRDEEDGAEDWLVALRKIQGAQLREPVALPSPRTILREEEETRQALEILEDELGALRQLVGAEPEEEEAVACQRAASCMRASRRTVVVPAEESWKDEIQTRRRSLSTGAVELLRQSTALLAAA